MRVGDFVFRSASHVLQGNDDGAGCAEFPGDHESGTDLRDHRGRLNDRLEPWEPLVHDAEHHPRASWGSYVVRWLLIGARAVVECRRLP